MYFAWKGRYSAVDKEEAHGDDDEAADSLLPSKSVHQRSNSISPRCLSIWTTLNIVMFLASLSLFSSWWYQTHWVRNAAYRQVSSHSQSTLSTYPSVSFFEIQCTFGLLCSLAPILDRLDLNPVITKINGTFKTPANPPFSRQMPNPVADEVWDEILIDRFIPISRAEIVKLGKDPTVCHTRVKTLPLLHFYFYSVFHPGELSWLTFNPGPRLLFSFSTVTGAWATMLTLRGWTSSINCTA